MLNTVWGVVRNGKVELLEPAPMPDGTRVLIHRVGRLHPRCKLLAAAM